MIKEPHGGFARRRQCLPPRLGDPQRGDFELVGAGAGRYAVFAGLNPTAANLLHHAIEMALKGALAKKGMDLKALKRLNHNLSRIWQEFTAQYGIDGSTFDGVIAELQKFETIRYPDEIVKQGLNSLIGWGKPSPPSGHTTLAL
jgi:hypothetical protein